MPTNNDGGSSAVSEEASVGLGPGSPHTDLRHQGQDIPEVAGMEAGVRITSHSLTYEGPNFWHVIANRTLSGGQAERAGEAQLCWTEALKLL